MSRWKPRYRNDGIVYKQDRERAEAGGWPLFAPRMDDDDRMHPDDQYLAAANGWPDALTGTSKRITGTGPRARIARRQGVTHGR